MEVFRRLQALEQELPSCYLQSWDDATLSTIDERLMAIAGDSISDLDWVAELEIAFRNELTKLFAQGHGGSLDPLVQLISLTLNLAKDMWIIVEQLTQKLTTPELFAKGRNLVLKMCNSLLRSLSRSFDTEFCGRILMFLASIFPISDRSAVNMTGKVNTSNVTYYVEENEFRRSILELHDVQDTKKIEEPVKSGEDGEEIELEKGQITYDMYKSFWKLQSYFASEMKSFDLPNPNQWKDFVVDANKVLDILLASQVEEAGQAGTQERIKEGRSSTVLYQGSKYLTSPQLRDPDVGQQVAAQVLMLCHYLRTRSLLTAEAKQDAAVEKEASGLCEKAQALMKPPVQEKDGKFLGLIEQWLKREEHWIRWKATTQCDPLDNPQHIERYNERMKVHNKESVEISEAGTDSTAFVGVKRKFGALSNGEGNKHSQSINATARFLALASKRQHCFSAGADLIEKTNAHQFECSEDRLKELLQGLSASLPELHSQIESYLEADDPDCGIDEEYHPKNNQLFCWRTRRLLMKDNLDLFPVMLDGNLGRGLRKLRNLPEPAVEPVVPPAMQVIEISNESKLDFGGKEEKEEKPIKVADQQPEEGEEVEMEVTSK